MINNKIKLINYSGNSTGSFGVILIDEENTNYIYKLMNISDNIAINKNNIIELIYYNLNFKENYGNMKIYETKIYNLKELLSIYEISEKNKNKLFKNDNLVNKIILIKMQRYKSTLYYGIKNFDISNRVLSFRYIANNIINGIDKLHSNNLIHGDIKSSNILYNSNLDVVLIDYGGIKHINNNKYNKTCTITTRAPEEFLYMINSGFASDIWSLGLIFCEILFGKNPIDDLFNLYSNLEEELIEVQFRNYYRIKRGIIIKINGYYVNNINYKYRESEYIILNVNNKNYNINGQIEKYVNLIENMLIIDYTKRINDIKLIYKIINDSEYNLRSNLIINKKKENILNDEYLEERKKIFIEIIEKIKIRNYDLIYLIPLAIKLLDNYLIRYTDDNFVLISDYEKKIVIYCLMMSSSIFLENKEISHKIINLLDLDINKENFYLNIFIDFIEDLNYDIYINEVINNNITKEELTNKLNDILENKKIDFVI